MNVRNFILTVFLVVLAFTALGCGAAATPVPATPTSHPGQALVSSRCSTCHPLGLVENSKFSQEGWQVLVDRMVASGAALSENQKIQVVDYLAKTYPLD